MSVRSLHASIDTSSNAHAYKETPGVKKLAEGYKVLPKETLSRLKEDIVTSVMVTIFFSCLVVPPAFGFVRIFNLSVVWAYVISGLFVIFCMTKLVGPSISWMRNDPTSPFVISKEHRANLKNARLIAAQLGESVVPVLTEEHVAAIYRVFFSLVRTPGPADQTDHDRITVLLFEDLNREPLLIDIITNRGINAMSEIEEALREIETDTIGPVQSGWL